MTQPNLDWVATRLQNQEDTIQQLLTDLKRQQRLILNLISRVQMLEQKLECHSRWNKCTEDTLQTQTHLEEMDE